MNKYTFSDKEYCVDVDNFLANPEDWDEDFARGMASKVGIFSGLSSDHWKIIRFIRQTYNKTGQCPLVYETCRTNHLHLQELKKLFPAGYLRGACKLAGITYKEGYLDQAGLEELAEKITSTPQEEGYEIDIRGFLINPSQWNEKFAAARAHEMKMPKLTEEHWKIIHYLRKSFEKNNIVPNIYDTCEANGIELDKLGELFPDGYHRGAVKIAGLRVR
jgi:TusE/DsrC/DsvC family sulfur relay protein